MGGEIPLWVEPTCRIACDWRKSGLSTAALFESASPDLGDEAAAIHMIRSHLSAHPELVASWQQYFWDKRYSPSPYLDGLEVRFFSASHERRDVVHHDTTIDACSHFIYREARWVLERRPS